MKILKNILIGASILTILTLPALSTAQVAIPDYDELIASAPITTASGVVDLIQKAAAWLQTIFFIVAIIFVVLAAFNYLTAQGEPEKIGKAKTMIIYAVVAVVVALVAFGIKEIVNNFLK